ncbi:Homocysteine S-methyltransferase YbgG [Araneus ventricosus]|uniref:Homocysteine S-methyltransferase YbgG n=1 Tax=Araneus ventricosus TaxID=182803 RepID=A0A4Y2MDS2_ARAVE|nr:Homocysteine S-methyltransferase YbgG [Araneus ventricosus]
MRTAATSSRAKYMQYLKSERSKEKTETKQLKRKALKEEIDFLKQKKMFLQTDMHQTNEKANDLANEAEKSKNMNLFIQSHELRKTISEKEIKINTLDDLINWHRPRIECLIDAGVDLLAFETIPSVKEGEALMRLLKDFPNVKAWLSFSCQSMHQTSHKEDIATSALTCMKMALPGQLIAIGVNCCPPEFAKSLLKDISTISDGFPLIVYPNSGEKWDNREGWSGDKVKTNSSYIESWIQSGAKIIGGCCRTTPNDIFDIHKYFNPEK